MTKRKQHTQNGVHMLSIFQSEVNEAFGKAFEAFELHTTGGGGGLLGRVANLFCDNWMESEI